MTMPASFTALRRGAAMIALTVLSTPALAAPATRPPAAFALCASCHPVTANGGNGMGPNLYGVVGRKPATGAGFAYSHAMQRKTGTWTAAELDAFLADPAARAPGNAMPAGPVASAADRKAIITYLATLRAR